MALTLLAMAQQCSDEISFARPSSLFSNPDTTARQMMALANREGYEQSTWGYWPQLRREYTFSTVANTASYALPADFSRFIGATAWDRDARWPLSGPIDAQEWQVFKSGFGNLGPRTRFRFMQGMLYLDPTPSSAVTIAFEYVSNGWAYNGTTYASAWAADTDTFVLDEQAFIMGLKWRLLKAKGLDFMEERKDWEMALNRAFARASGARTLSMGQRWDTVRLLSNSNIPDTSFGS